MTPEYFAKLTLEYWRASGARTEARRDALLISFLTSYFGPDSAWSKDVRATHTSAALWIRKATRIDELSY